MSDARKLLLTRGIRGLADGVVSVALARYLTGLGFSALKVGAGLAPLITGVLLEKTTFGWPLVIGGALKAAYDIALLSQFLAVRTREEGVH